MYNTDLSVIYNTNLEYRNCMRKMFQMEQQNLDDLELDEETLDEQDYDNANASKTLDYIYSITKSNALFKELYEYAAATMLSQNFEIGLAVLFSYDYFILFHPCLCTFILDSSKWTDTDESFIALKTRLTK
jgi:hypothetical protein